jgi:hypothetical protein
MCADCHELFKAASRVYDRQIVCSDSRIVHVFEGGGCSCGDLWRGGGGDPEGAKGA